MVVLLVFGEWGFSGTQKELWQGGIFYTNAVLSGDGSRSPLQPKEAVGTNIKTFSRPTVRYQKSTKIPQHFDGNAQIFTNSHGYNQPSLVMSNDGSYAAAATTNNVVSFSTGLIPDPIQVVNRIQVDHTISSIKLVETDTSSAIYVGGSNKVTKIFIAGDADDPDDESRRPFQRPARWWSMHRTCHILAVQLVQPIRLLAL